MQLQETILDKTLEPKVSMSKLSIPQSSQGTTPSQSLREYFVPRDGFNREVIFADITRYLGNDALVRPANYSDPQTGVTQQGCFITSYITSYINLTAAMITDLIEDPRRWEAERGKTATAYSSCTEDSNASSTSADWRCPTCGRSAKHVSLAYYMEGVGKDRDRGRQVWENEVCHCGRREKHEQGQGGKVYYSAGYEAKDTDEKEQR